MFCQKLPQNILSSVRFFLRTPLFLSDFRTLWFLSDFTSKPSRFCHILPQRPLVCHIYLRTLQFLSHFTSEPLSFCQIFPQNVLGSVRFYFTASQFLSDITSESLNFCQTLPQNILALSDFTSTFQVLSDFTSEFTSFCQNLLQDPLVPVTFYLTMLKFLSDFCLRTPWFLSDFTSDPSSFCQILLTSLQFLSDLTSESSLCQILPQISLVSLRFLSHNPIVSFYNIY